LGKSSAVSANKLRYPLAQNQGSISQKASEFGAARRFGALESRLAAAVRPARLQSGHYPQKLFSVRRRIKALRTGLVQQTVQIVARFARTI